MSGEITLCVNTDILIEYEEIIAQKTTKEIAHNVVEAIASLHTTHFQETYIHCAIASDAEFIVTNDKHFNVLKELEWPKIVVLTIDEFASQI